MRSPSTSALHVIDIGSPEWCWSHLGPAGEGVLSYPAARSRANVAVPYTVTDHVISIPVAALDGPGWSTIGEDVCLQIGGVALDDLRWVVRASGKAERPDRTRASSLAWSRLMHPAADRTVALPADQLVLVTPRVRGFYETALTAS